MARARLAIADDHPLIRLGIRRALERDGGFDLVGEAAGISELVPLIERTAPDAVRGRFGRRPAIVVISGNGDPALIESAFRHGAVGYVVTTIAVQDLGPAVREALAGGAFHAYGFAAPTGGAQPRGGLTRRELAVLHAVSRGLSNRAAAGELAVGEQTVKYHLTNVYRKLGVSNRTEAMRWALVHGDEPAPPG